MQVVQELYEEVGNFVLYVIPYTGIMPTMNWHITVRTRTAKHIQFLPARVRQSLDLLLADLATRGRCEATGPTIASLVMIATTATSKKAALRM